MKVKSESDTGPGNFCWEGVAGEWLSQALQAVVCVSRSVRADSLQPHGL